MKQLISKITSSIMALIMVTALSATYALALNDGAYLVSRTTSYANPETGKTVDGGTDIALGDSMCASIVDDKVLVEKVGNKYYVTLGLGLASNVSNVRMQVQGSNGKYKNVSVTKTGSCTRNDDTCNHYRFQVDDPSNYISPIFYVDPMGRDVQFFVKLNMGSATKGTGNFKAEMVKSTDSKSPVKKSETKQSSVTTKARETNSYTFTTTEVAADDSHGSYSADTKEAGKKVLNILLICLGTLAAVIVLVVVLVKVVKKRK